MDDWVCAWYPPAIAPRFRRNYCSTINHSTRPIAIRTAKSRKRRGPSRCRIHNRLKEMAMAARKIAKRNWYKGSSLDDWLKEEGWYEEFNAAREKERIARQIDQ